ncbi:MAG: hypothetical protein NTX03_14890 [Bacteroidetes bacterium]|nr:hypothetical protein [Bacteroidota bacterium]
MPLVFTTIVDVKTNKFIKKDSKAIIGSDGLMGNKVMNISAGTAGVAMIKDNEVIATTLPISMDAMLLKLKDAVDNAAIITGDLAVVIGNVKSGKGTIGKLFMDEGFANSLDGTITNVKQGTKGFQQNMDGLKTSIDVAKNNFFLKGLFSKPLTEAEEKKLKADNKLKEDIKQKEQQKIKDEKEKAEQKIKDDKLKLKEEKQKVKDEENRIKEDKKDFDKEEKQKIKDEKKKLKEDKKNLRDSE